MVKSSSLCFCPTQFPAEVPGHARHAGVGVGCRPDGAGLDGDGEGVPVPRPGGQQRGAPPLRARRRHHQGALHRSVRLRNNYSKWTNFEKQFELISKLVGLIKCIYDAFLFLRCCCHLILSYFVIV